jgi:hypothetical protein
MRLLTPEEQARFQNRAHFFAAAAEAMRRILVESASDDVFTATQSPRLRRCAS